MHGLCSRNVWLWWLCAGGVLLWYRRQIHRSVVVASYNEFKALDGKTKILLLGCLLILGMTWITALLAPPNTWDSMTYHLPRVMHWQQNQSVEPYPTHILRQVFLAPLAEYGILQWHLLCGGDWGDNFQQWFAFVGCLVAVSLIARELGANRRGQVLTAVVAVTLPEAILQASSTQNDLAVSYFICTMVFFFLRWRREPTLTAVAGMMLSLGLAMLTKGTVYFFAAPFLGWAGCAIIYRWRGRGLGVLILAGLLVLVLNAPFLLRVHSLFGQCLPQGEGTHYTLGNEVFGWRPLLSNLLRNTTLHLGLPFPWSNKLIMYGVTLVHHWLGLSLQESTLTLPRTTFQVIWKVHEDLCGNPWHLLLVVIFSTGWLFCRPVAVNGCRRYFLCILGGLVLFCVLLKWQPWHTRLHLPLFLLATPLVGMGLEHLTRSILRWSLVLCLMCGAIIVAVFNESRPWLGPSSIFCTSREQQLYFNRPELQPCYAETCAWLMAHNACSVGLLLPSDGGYWEYPVWFECRQTRKSMPRIEHIQVNNVSTVLEQCNPQWRGFMPNYVLNIRAQSQSSFVFHERKYIRVFDSHGFQIFQASNRVQPQDFCPASSAAIGR